LCSPDQQPTQSRALAGITPFKSLSVTPFATPSKHQAQHTTTAADKEWDNTSQTSSSTASSNPRTRKRGADANTQEPHEVSIKDVIRACKRRGKAAQTAAKVTLVFLFVVVVVFSLKTLISAQM
jgi:hypothetical protein